MTRPRRGLDRIRSPDERLLERGDRVDATDGRAALFSDGPPVRHRLTVHCEGCDATSALDATTALRSALPLFLLAPWKDHPVFALCPACRRRSWLRVQR